MIFHKQLMSFMFLFVCFVVLCFSVVLETEPRIPFMLGKYSTISPDYCKVRYFIIFFLVAQPTCFLETSKTYLRRQQSALYKSSSLGSPGRGKREMEKLSPCLFAFKCHVIHTNTLKY